MSKSAYLNGYNDYYDGFDLKDNPYKDDVEEFEWMDGWLDAWNDDADHDYMN